METEKILKKLQTEIGELNAKIAKLKTFLKSGKSFNLEFDEIIRLNLQYNYMCLYKDVLKNRIAALRGETV